MGIRQQNGSIYTMCFVGKYYKRCLAVSFRTQDPLSGTECAS